ncbi:MAG: hypothetical protein ACJAUV_001476 [Flavobacteriales bacterium]|jgi:hypothetical protein
MKTCKAICLTLLMCTISTSWATGGKEKETTRRVPVATHLIKENVVALTSTKYGRSFYSPESLNEAADHIIGQLYGWNITPEMQYYNIGQVEVKNIIYKYGDKEKPVLVIGAHYDVFNNMPGADGNASGVAVMLELIRLVKLSSPQLDYRIEFVFYGLHEDPFFGTENMGSFVHAKTLKDRKAKVKAMIALDMVGYYSDESGSQAYPTRMMKMKHPNKGNFVALISNDNLLQEYLNIIESDIEDAADIKVETFRGETGSPALDFADHYNYAVYGWEAILVSNTGAWRNQNYHQITDIPASLDYKKMTELTQGLYEAIVKYK